MYGDTRHHVPLPPWLPSLGIIGTGPQIHPSSQDCSQRKEQTDATYMGSIKHPSQGVIRETTKQDDFHGKSYPWPLRWWGREFGTGGQRWGLGRHLAAAVVAMVLAEDASVEGVHPAVNPMGFTSPSQIGSEGPGKFCARIPKTTEGSAWETCSFRNRSNFKETTTSQAPPTPNQNASQLPSDVAFWG